MDSNAESEFAVLKIGGREIRLPVVVGTEGEKAFDIGALRKETGYVSLDRSLTNTAVCYSRITFIARFLLYRLRPRACSATG